MVAIVFIGVLFMGTLPKFSNLTVDARNAANQALSDTLQTTIENAHKAWVSGGAPTIATGSNVVVDGQVIHVNYMGWPDNSKGVLPIAADCAILWNTLLNNAPIAGCVSCREPCTSTATNGCYITSAKGTSCTFILSTNPGISIEYSLGAGIVVGTAE